MTESDKTTWQSPQSTVVVTPKPDAPKHVEHPVVVAQHIRVEGVDAVFPREARQALEEPRADAVPLQGIGDGERHLGAIDRIRIPVETSEGHDPASRFRDQ